MGIGTGESGLFDAGDKRGRDIAAETLSGEETKRGGLGHGPRGTGDGIGEQGLDDTRGSGRDALGLERAGGSIERDGEIEPLGTKGEGLGEGHGTGELARKEEGEHLDHLGRGDGGDPWHQPLGFGIVLEHGRRRDKHEIAPTGSPKVIAIVGRQLNLGSNIACVLEREAVIGGVGIVETFHDGGRRAVHVAAELDFQLTEFILFHKDGVNEKKKLGCRGYFFAFGIANVTENAQLCTRKTKDGGCSSDWLERQIVALEVAGSIPVTHPQF